MDVVFPISSSLVKIRLHTKNQLPITALIVLVPGVVWLWCGVVFLPIMGQLNKRWVKMFWVVGWVVANT
jgi:hypothetical protein